MPRRRWLVGCSVLAATMGWGVSSTYAGDEVRKPSERTATKDASKATAAAKRRAAKQTSFLLHGVRWYRGLDAAQALRSARATRSPASNRTPASKRRASAKPILWLRVLGDPTGNT